MSLFSKLGLYVTRRKRRSELMRLNSELLEESLRFLTRRRLISRSGTWTRSLGRTPKRSRKDGSRV
jgi:hypothetical protein